MAALKESTREEKIQNEEGPSGHVNISKDLLNVGKLKENPLHITEKTRKQNKIDPPQIFRPAPSSVLGRLKDFLPKMAAAQDDLQKRMQMEASEEFNIENTEGCDKVIEMSVALVEHNSNSESEDDDNEEEEDSDVDLGPVTEETMKLPKPKLIPNIEILDNQVLPNTELDNIQR